MTTHPTPTLFLMGPQEIAHLPWQSLPGSSGVQTKVVYDAGDTVAGLLRLRPDAKEISHLHLHEDHHMWVLHGSVVIDDTELAAGSYLHVPARLTHTMRDCGPGSVVFFVFTPASSAYGN